METSLSLRRWLLSAMWVMLCVMNVSAETRYVAQAGQMPSPNYTSWATAASNIQDAVDIAVTGDTILVASGVYDAGGVFAGGQTNRVYINNKKLTLQAVSANPEDTMIVGGGTLGPDAVRCVLTEGTPSDNSIISGFTLTNGYAQSNGGGLRASRYLTLTNCWVVGCVAATNGGGVSVVLSATLVDCVIADNEAAVDGGGVEGRNSGGWESPVIDSLIIGNRSGKDGGGMFRCVATNSTVVGNSAPRGGGGYYTFAYDSTFSNNVATSGDGGALYGKNFLVSHCVISSNSAARNAGGVWGVILTNGCLIADNFCSKLGGGGAEVYAVDAVFANNTSGEAGGALSTSGDMNRVYTTNCLFYGNQNLTGNGAGQNGGTTVDCVFSNNVSLHRGGGASALDAINCLFVGNVATNGDGHGGGLYAGSAVNSRFIGNTAIYGGGAFRSQLVNCLLVRNHAIKGSGGVHGGSQAGISSVVLQSCTVADNTVMPAGGGAGFTTPIYVTNCIVWANVQLTDGATNNWSTSSTSSRFAHCCVSPLPTGVQDNGNNMDVNPRFVDADGGDYRLRASSPCVNTGMNLDWMIGAVDLDGQPRIFPPDGVVDIGAFERIPGNTATILLIR